MQFPPKHVLPGCYDIYTTNKNCSAVFIISKLMACSTIGFHLFHWPKWINVYNSFSFLPDKICIRCQQFKTLHKKNCISHSNKGTRSITITGHTTTTSATVLHQNNSLPCLISSFPWCMFTMFCRGEECMFVWENGTDTSLLCDDGTISWILLIDECLPPSLIC